VALPTLQSGMGGVGPRRRDELLVALIKLTRRAGLRDAAFGALVAAFPNTGFMGVPLLVALRGEAAAGPVICTILADMLLTSSLCVGLASARESGASGTFAASGRAVRGAFSNPLPWSIALGALLGAFGWKLPGPVDTIVRMLADAASPVALFTIGAVLWRAGEHARLEAESRALEASVALPTLQSGMGGVGPRRRDELLVALIKLLLHPAIVFGLGLAAQRLGAPLDNFQLSILTLAAALPSASNVSLLAERYGADNGRVARIILISTVLSFVTFTLLAWTMEHSR